ncbi:MAG TPA: sensor histidine kinase [Caulobacteraceae bacterium]|nr:sensor histidine kinase [Caulobacteraceae bacterium]
MNRLVRAARRRATTIRVRLGLALAVALLPILLLSAVQTALGFRRQALDDRANLVAAAERSAATAKARIGAAEVLLQTLAPGSTGLECAQRLAQIKDEIPGYANLIRLSESGRVACSAATVPADPGRRERPWFRTLAAGAPMTVTSEPGVAYAAEPALIAGVRAETAAGQFEGVLAAVITLASLRPVKADRSIPAGAEVAITDAEGRYLSTTSAAAFPVSLAGRLAGSAREGPSLWRENDLTGALRVYSSAPLVGQDVYVLLSAPAHGVVFWALVNPVSAVALPILAFLLALAAVWIVAERGVVRWIAYLQRIAAIYGRGRFTVHPLKAESAPPEIRDLAHALDAMAETIAARDAALKDSLVQKDELMREIHHRVKNNLQVISSLLNMQQRALTDPAARAAMSDTRQRITALALVYRALYQGPDLKRVDLHDFLDELISQLVMSETGKGGLIRTELAIDPLIIDPDRLAPLALFAVEAITNARKHGLGEAGGVLRVAFTVHGPMAELAISDTGAAGTAARVGEGVGRTLMTAFARQLRGEVAFSANPGGGLTARLTFPTPDAPETATLA